MVLSNSKISGRKSMDLHRSAGYLSRTGYIVHIFTTLLLSGFMTSILKTAPIYLCKIAVQLNTFLYLLREESVTYFQKKIMIIKSYDHIYIYIQLFCTYSHDVYPRSVFAQFVYTKIVIHSITLYFIVMKTGIKE